METGPGEYEKSAKELLARLNRIPTWSLPASFIAIIGIGYFFTFFDISDIGFAMPAIAFQFRISPDSFVYLFLALSIGLIGYVVGSYVIGTISDLTGRFNAMILTMVITAVGSFGDAVSINIPMLTVFRFVTGIGLGADLNLVSSYITEFAPQHIRGRITIYAFLIGIMGQTITPFIALVLVHGTGPGWRYLFVIGGVISVIAFILRSKLPESPRWLVTRRHDLKSAEKVITDMERIAISKVGNLPQPLFQDVVLEEVKFPTLYLFRRPYSKRLAILAAMWFFWYIGNYGFLGDAATLVTELGIDVSSSILYLAIGAIGYPIGAVIMIFTADRFERKMVIFADAVVWTIGMATFSTATREGFLFGAFLASLSLGMFLQVAYTFTAESYPTRARASGFALTDGIGHAGGALGAIILPVIVVAYNFSTGFIFIGITGLAAGIFALAGPVSSKKSLEEISA